ncbi:type I-E CRISPR-associated protein Cas6/Cse3/CasE [Embleya sp. AB8]|uniref:type I-E CRISPR-associated protein Cas6/Cse3/CasE n=1 Tax=Embleya sp. AB8 TaxID=3156304 RepID=UPI003C78AA4B
MTSTAAGGTARFVATHSILTLKATHPYTAKALIDAQDMHRNVMSGFYGWTEDGHRDARAQMGVLSTWSVDLKNACLVLVVQSRVPGDWSRVPRAALSAKPHTITVDRTVRTGDVLHFRTVINPTRTRRVENPGTEKVRGARVPHTTPDQTREWFVRRLQPAGEPAAGPEGVARIGAVADADSLGVRMLPAISSSGPHKGLRIARAEIRGALTVTDPQTFVNTLTEGIGRARAYGCGLLLTRD